MLTKFKFMGVDKLNCIEKASIAFSVIMILLTVFGIWSSFSSVPYWDMWNGALSFILDTKNGEMYTWWTQHNEHRIFLSRVLFFVDYKMFGGEHKFLIIMNLVFASLSGILFFLFARALRNEANKQNFNVLTFLNFGFVFSWAQYENFTWAFQSQFFLAQILPLAALYFLARSSHDKSIKFFGLALTLGILSAGTMANGILILPLMSVYLIVVWMGIGRLLLMATCAVLVLTLYFSDYVSVGGHGSISESILNDPLGLILYTVTYLGSPFYHFTWGADFSLALAAIFGTFLIVYCVILFFRLIFNLKSPYVIALLCFIAYIGATALGTAGGRLIFGISTATSSRYATPAIMAWAALLLIFLDQKTNKKSVLSKLQIFIISVTCILVVSAQFKVFKITGRDRFERDLAGLALELGVRDQAVISKVFPSVDYVMGISELAKKQSLSIFGNYPLNGLSESLGQSIEEPSASDCIGYLDSTYEIESDQGYLNLNGWFFDRYSRDVPKLLTFANEQGIIIGAGLTGDPRPDVGEAVNLSAFNSGFSGYILRQANRSKITAISDAPSCKLTFVLP